MDSGCSGLTSEPESELRQLHEGGSGLDNALLARLEDLSEVADPAQSGRQLYLDSCGGGEIDRILWMEPESYPFIGNVVPVESVAKQPASSIEQGGILAAEDDPSEWPGLGSPQGWTVRVDQETLGRVDPQREPVPPESVHRDRDLYVTQERSHWRRVTRIVQPRRQMHAEFTGLHNGVVGRTRNLGSPTGQLISAAILRPTVQSHEADGRAQDAFLTDTRQSQEFGKIDVCSFASSW